MPEESIAGRFDPGHVVLVGMMGSGKTTVGRRVARKLDLDFVDTDAELVTQSGRSIADWFTDEGEDAFRAAESDVVARILDSGPTRVVATGGGVVLADANRARLAESRHTVIWLRAGPAFLTSRITRKSEQKARPLLSGDTHGALDRLDAERRDLYAEVADIVIDIEPVMSDDDHPRKKLSRLIIDTLGRTGVQVRR
ncbi:MAG TPA: shikimate kinase [Acidimicrobiales bacterium]|nr:shikimate kinase [Acidimicrobiales bacterium]